MMEPPVLTSHESYVEKLDSITLLHFEIGVYTKITKLFPEHSILKLPIAWKKISSVFPVKLMWNKY